jgi:hypothetical protein
MTIYDSAQIQKLVQDPEFSTETATEILMYICGLSLRRAKERIAISRGWTQGDDRSHLDHSINP